MKDKRLSDVVRADQLNHWKATIGHMFPGGWELIDVVEHETFLHLEFKNALTGKYKSLAVVYA